jgi:hypothetical protein
VGKSFNPSTVVMTLSILVASVLFASLLTVLSSTPSSPGKTSLGGTSPQGCDQTGDANSFDDCLHTVVDAISGGQKIAAGKAFVSHITINTSLQGHDLVLVTQYRSQRADGTFGAWWSHRATHWFAEDTSKSTERDITTCAPAKAGGYEMRTVMVSAAGTRAGGPPQGNAMGSIGGTVPSGLYTVQTTALGQTASSGCERSASDELNVEYFNQLNFEGLITINVQASATSYSLALQCPTPVPGFASDLRVVMETTDSAQMTECSTGSGTSAPIVITGADQANKAVCPRALTCEVNIFAESRSTGTIYSTTLLAINLPVDTASSPTNIEPQLEAATLPICDITLKFGPGSYPPITNEGPLSLCEDSASCTTPPTSGYSVDSKVYFQTFLVDKITT